MSAGAPTCHFKPFLCVGLNELYTISAFKEYRLEAKMDKRHAHMYRLLYTLIGAAVIGCGLLARIAFF